MNIIIQKGKVVEPSKVIATAPLGVEYEKLIKNLQEKNIIKDMRNNKNFPLDLIEHKDKKDLKTTMLMPGMLIDYETNMFAPYPQSDIPYSSGSSWIGGIYD